MRRKTEAQKRRDREQKKAKRDAEKAAGTYVRQIQVKRSYVPLWLVDPEDYSNPRSDVRMGP